MGWQNHCLRCVHVVLRLPCVVYVSFQRSTPPFMLQVHCAEHCCHLHRPMQIKVIDFGAACDLSTGINFNPEYGMLDPRYSGELCCIGCFVV